MDSAIKAGAEALERTPEHAWGFLVVDRPTGHWVTAWLDTRKAFGGMDEQAMVQLLGRFLYDQTRVLREDEGADG